VKNIIDKFYRSLVEAGWLSVGPSESSHLLLSQFVTVNFPGATLYKKGGAGEREKEKRREEEKSRQRDGEERELLSLQLPEIKFPPQVSRTNLLASDLSTPVMAEVASAQVAPPSSAEDLYQEAVVLYEQGRYAEAVKKLEDLLARQHENAPAYALLARAYANQGQLAQALEYCQKALVADKLNAGYYYLRATILQEQGAVGEAIQSLKRALYLDHDFVLAHFALGNLVRQQSKQSGAGVLPASKHFANALQLLRNYRPTDVLPESEGITAGRLAAIITTMTEGQG
jgi:chemotaxis protein methyltransferase CheR